MIIFYLYIIKLYETTYKDGYLVESSKILINQPSAYIYA